MGGTGVMLDGSPLIGLSNVPANITVEATGPSGAVVTYASPTATDLVDPHPTITATPPSGSTFPLGTTTVTVKATDQAGNTASAQFIVNVQDTTPPVISDLPTSITVEATDPSGAVVTYTSPTATDLVDPHPTIIATLPSGSTFPLGTTTVTVTATDHSGNAASAQFTVNVQDTRPPVLSNVPANITVEATDPSGAVVTYTSPTATDRVDPHPTITTTPPSGGSFPLGSTTVAVTATDQAGNTTSATFIVTVLAPIPTSPQVVGIASVQSRKGLTAFIVVFNERPGFGFGERSWLVPRLRGGQEAWEDGVHQSRGDQEHPPKWWGDHGHDRSGPPRQTWSCGGDDPGGAHGGQRGVEPNQLLEYRLSLGFPAKQGLIPPYPRAPRGAARALP